jgi:CheY-like chemotaxis protein
VAVLDRPGKLLIVDDDISIRNSLSLIFSKLGYRVRSAEGAFSALSEIRSEIPDVLLSDVNMAHLPNLEFLLVVRRWFPSIRVIAIGEALSSNRVPPGVAADAAYQKCPNPTLLIEFVDEMTQTKRPAIRLSMEDLFGFRVFEAIPSHPGSELLKFPANRAIVFPLLPKEQQREFISFAGVPRTQEVSSV